MSVHICSIKGNRESNEDNHTTHIAINKKNKKKTNLYGIYDGHGGDYVSYFLKKNIEKYFLKTNEYHLSNEYIYKSFDSINNELYKNHYKKSVECGSTCLFIYHYFYDKKEHIIIMNTGDSRCVLCKNNFAYPLTKDHKPDWPEEKYRLQSCGGYVHEDRYGTFRIKDLSVSKSFGDYSSKKYISYKPDIFRSVIDSNSDKFIVLGCDGLWDVMSSQDVVNFILNNTYNMKNMTRINHDTNIASRLANCALKNGSNDNITIIIVFF